MQDVFGPYREKSLEDFQVRHESHRPALDTVEDYIKHLDPRRLAGRGLTVMGPNGVGKTLLCSCILNEAKQRGYRVESIELASYIELFKDKFDIQALLKAGHEDSVDRFVTIKQHIRFIQGSTKKGADWLLLDDVGRENASGSGWSQNEVFDTLRFRWNRGLPTLLTTNLDMAALEERYTKGLGSFLQEATDIVVVEGEDYRWRKAS